MTSSTGGEFRGKTVEEAIEAGLAALGKKRNQVEIEVVSKGSRGLLGFGAEDACVRLTPIARRPPAPAAPPPAETSDPRPAPRPQPEPRPAPPPPAKPVSPPPSKPTPAPELPPAPAMEEMEEGEQDLAEVAVEILQGLLDRMGVAATAEVVDHEGVLEASEEPPLVLNIEGEDLGILIGRRGETLAALQYLLRLMVNHRMKKWSNLVVDVEGYKGRREQQLRQLAERMAARVVETGRAVALEAMPARERRIVHIALRNHPEVTTQSVGEDEQRKVTIIPRV